MSHNLDKPIFAIYPAPFTTLDPPCVTKDTKGWLAKCAETHSNYKQIFMEEGGTPMNAENFATSIVITGDNREEIEKLYGKIPPESELLEAPQTHSLEEARQSMHPLEKSLNKLNDEAEEVPPDETNQQNT